MLKFNRLSLTSRAIILLATPILFELGSTALLLDLQRQAEQEAERALRSRQLADHINNLNRHMFKVWDVVNSSNKKAWTSSEFLSGGYRGPTNDLRQEYDAIYKLAVQDKDEKLQATVKASLIALENSEKLLDQICTDMNRGVTSNLYSDGREFQQALKRNYKAMVSHEYSLVNQEKENFLRASPRRLREFRQQTINIFLVALAGNVAFSVILAIYLVRRVTSRLEHLSSEMRKLGSGRPLSRPLTGGDEIAALSRVLSTMSIELNTHLRREGAIVANARDTVCSIDDKGCFNTINPAGEKLFAAMPGEMVASRFIEYIHQKDRGRALEWYHAARDGKPVDEIELSITAADGRQLTTVWSGQWSEQDRLLFCIIYDVSERKEIEAARQELTAMLTHDLRSPLNTIQACFEMLEAGRLGPLNERGSQLVRVAQRNGRRMMTLINDMLDIEKIKDGAMTLEREQFQMSEIFEDVKVDTADWMAENKITLQLHATAQSVNADREKIERVIFNLVSNAIKFSPPDSVIMLAASRRGSSIEVAVSDQGPGIPQDQLESVFERFAQVASPENKGRGGSGLGLTICRAIVELHGGKIWAESSPGKTRIIFVLPQS